MNEESCQALLSAIYELEGLVRMLKGHKHDASVLIPMIKQKGNQIAKIAASMPGVAPAAAEAKEKEDRTRLLDGEVHEAFGTEEATVEPDVDQAPAITGAGIPVFAPRGVMPAPPVVKAAETVHPAPQIAPGAPKAAPKSVPGDAVPVTEPQERKPRRPSLRSMFPLNETFRFPRTLFNGSKEDFYTSLDIVVPMHTYDQACAYFYGDLQWNPEDPEVREFMHIIERYFTNSPY